MKKIIPVLLAALAAITSCTGVRNNDTTEAQLTIDSLQLERKDTLMEITCNLQFTTQGGTASDSINASISQHILDQGRNSNVPEAMQQYVSHTYDQNKDEVTDMRTQGEYFADMLYSFDHQGRFLDDTPDSTLTYSAESYIYTGGAHGYHWHTYLNFSRQTGHLITLDEVLDLSHSNDIIQLILQNLMQQFSCDNIQQLEEQGFVSISEITLTNNFHLGSRGITFIYNPYEIACYAMGKQSVTLTYQQLEPYMK